MVEDVGFSGGLDVWRRYRRRGVADCNVNCDEHMMRTILVVMLLSFVVSACNAPIPDIDYLGISDSLPEYKTQIIGSNVAQKFPLDHWTITVLSIDGVEIKTDKSVWLIDKHSPSIVDPGLHVIDIRMHQGLLNGYAQFELDMKPGILYVARARPESNEYVQIWIENYSTGIPVTEKIRALRERSGTVILVL